MNECATSWNIALNKSPTKLINIKMQSTHIQEVEAATISTCVIMHELVNLRTGGAWAPVCDLGSACYAVSWQWGERTCDVVLFEGVAVDLVLVGAVLLQPLTHVLLGPQSDWFGELHCPRLDIKEEMEFRLRSGLRTQFRQNFSDSKPHTCQCKWFTH